MKIGFRKGFGGEFHLNTSTKLGAKSRKETASTIKKKENEQFLNEFKKQLDGCTVDFFMEHNIHPHFISYLSELEASELFKNNQKALQDFTELDDVLNNAKRILEKINMGQNLTQTRKDKLIDILYEAQELSGTDFTSELENAIMKNNKDMNLFYEIFTKYYHHELPSDALKIKRSFLLKFGILLLWFLGIIFIPVTYGLSLLIVPSIRNFIKSKIKGVTRKYY